MFKTIIDRLSLYQLLSCVLIIIVLLALTIYRLEGGTTDTYAMYVTPTPQATSEPTQATAEPTPQPTPQPIKITALGEFRYTYYTNSIADCGNTKGITFSGIKAVEGITIAADLSVIPMGTYVYLEHIGVRKVQDIGGAVKGNIIDIYVNEKSDKLPGKGKVYLLGGD